MAPLSPPFPPPMNICIICCSIVDQAGCNSEPFCTFWWTYLYILVDIFVYIQFLVDLFVYSSGPLFVWGGGFFRTKRTPHPGLHW